MKRKDRKKFLIGLGDIIDMFISTHIKISILESKVKNPSISNEEAGKAARLIRCLNLKRIALRNIINERFGEGFEDIKVEYYEVLEKP